MRVGANLGNLAPIFLIVLEPPDIAHIELLPSEYNTIRRYLSLSDVLAI